MQGPSAILGKAKFTWVTSAQGQERYIAASCGNYTVLWNFRRVKAAQPNAISSGAFTLTKHYTLISKDEQVVDNAFMHDAYVAPAQRHNALVVATQHKLWNYRDDDESSEFGD